MVLNDSSQDATPKILSFWASKKEIEIIDKPNTGHGPTILWEYHHRLNFKESL